MLNNLFKSSCDKERVEKTAMKKVFFKSHDVKAANEKLIDSRGGKTHHFVSEPKESVFGVSLEELRFDRHKIIENINKAGLKASLD